MKASLIGINLLALAPTSACATAQIHDVEDQGVTVHSCTKNPLLRSVGLFGGEQPEIFLSRSDIRREPPPAVDSLTRVLDVTEVDHLRDPGAEPVIDKCSSRLRTIGEDEVDLSIQWRDRNCPDSFDEEDLIECRSRASFKFCRRDLGMQEVLCGVADPDVALQRLLVIDAYFTQEIQPLRLRERIDNSLIP